MAYHVKIAEKQGLKKKGPRRSKSNEKKSKRLPRPNYWFPYLVGVGCALECHVPRHCRSCGTTALSAACNSARAISATHDVSVHDVRQPTLVGCCPFSGVAITTAGQSRCGCSANSTVGCARLALPGFAGCRQASRFTLRC